MSGKYEKKNSGKKSIALLLALVLLVGCVAGGTIAWLVTQTAPVTNTFVAGKIGTLTLKEDNETNASGKEYIVTPGEAISKDPKVRFSGATVDAYVFVEIQGNGWTYADGTYQTADGNLSFAIDTTVWKPVAGQTGVFYQEVAARGEIAGVEVIKDSTITVKNSINAENIETIVSAAQTLSFKAYAIQKAGSNDAAAAWTKLKTP